jgi:hypothetical protein
VHRDVSEVREFIRSCGLSEDVGHEVISKDKK